MPRIPATRPITSPAATACTTASQAKPTTGLAIALHLQHYTIDQAMDLTQVNESEYMEKALHGYINDYSMTPEQRNLKITNTIKLALTGIWNGADSAVLWKDDPAWEAK